MDCTIFIRTRNEADKLSEALAAIFAQKTELRYQVIVLDSESTDDTKAVLKKHSVTSFSIPKKNFTYSGALNLGVSLSKTPYFICLSGDAVPANSNWLQSLVDPLISDLGIACSFSKHVAWSDAPESSKTFLEKEFPDWPKEVTPKTLEQEISNEEPYDIARFSNTSACYRRELLVMSPFKEIRFSEDRLAALLFLQSGHSIFYQPESIIYHSHKASFDAFRKVAKLSTEARAVINKLGYENSKKQRHSSYARLLIIQALKIPYLLALLSLQALTFSRSFVNSLADLGTSFGKLEAYAALNRSGVPSSLPVASIEELRKHLATL